VVFRLGDGNEPSTNIMSDGQPAPDVICVAKEAVALHHGEEACGSRIVIPANYRGQARSRVGPATAGDFSATNGGKSRSSSRSGTLAVRELVRRKSLRTSAA
jgi:hypothetical protein